LAGTGIGFKEKAYSSSAIGHVVRRSYRKQASTEARPLMGQGVARCSMTTTCLASHWPM